MDDNKSNNYICDITNDSEQIGMYLDNYLKVYMMIID